MFHWKAYCETLLSNIDIMGLGNKKSLVSKQLKKALDFAIEAEELLPEYSSDVLKDKIQHLQGKISQINSLLGISSQESTAVISNSLF